MAAGLVEKGHRVTFCAQSRGRANVLPDDADVYEIPVYDASRLCRFLRLPHNRAKFTLAVPKWKKIRHLVAELRPDIIIVRDVSLAMMAITWAARFTGTPVWLYDQHGLVLQGRSAWLHKIVSRCGFLPSRRLTTVRKPHYGPENDQAAQAVFLPFPVIVPEDKKEAPAYSRRPPIKILIIGKLHQPRKNNYATLHALCPLLRQNMAMLTMVGSLPKQETHYRDQLLDLARSNGVEEQVAIRANLAYDQCLALYEEHDILVMPSHDEPAGFVILEAMAHALPVICSHDAGLSYVVEDGINGYRFQRRNFQQLQDIVRHLVKSPEDIERMGRNARYKIEREHSPEHCARALEALHSTYELG
jgi:glycosyltransferase involved in cell wall biosynthesis